MSVKLEELDKEELLKLWSHMHEPCEEEASGIRATLLKESTAEQVQDFIDELCESGKIRGEAETYMIGRDGNGNPTEQPDRATRHVTYRDNQYDRSE